MDFHIPSFFIGMVVLIVIVMIYYGICEAFERRLQEEDEWKQRLSEELSPVIPAFSGNPSERYWIDKVTSE